MTALNDLAARLRPVHVRGLLLAGLLVSLAPLSRRTPRTQILVLELPERFRDARGRVDVTWTRDGDSEPLGGFTETFPEGAPAALRREISVPDGIYRLDVSLEGLGKAAIPGRTPSRIEIVRQLSLNGTLVRVLLSDTPP